MSVDLDTQFRPPAEFRPAIKRMARRLVRKLTPIAREMGYGLMVHGSLERDLDLLAVPWVEEAASPRDLVKALAAETPGYWSSKPEQKPHGREAYTILLKRGIETPNGSFPFIDLSVMPPRAPNTLAPASGKAETPNSEGNTHG